jgi:hypothetical protein
MACIGERGMCHKHEVLRTDAVLLFDLNAKPSRLVLARRASANNHSKQILDYIAFCAPYIARAIARGIDAFQGESGEHSCKKAECVEAQQHEAGDTEA